MMSGHTGRRAKPPGPCGGCGKKITGGFMRLHRGDYHAECLLAERDGVKIVRELPDQGQPVEYTLTVCVPDLTDDRRSKLTAALTSTVGEVLSEGKDHMRFLIRILFRDSSEPCPCDVRSSLFADSLKKLRKDLTGSLDAFIEQLEG